VAFWSVLFVWFSFAHWTGFSLASASRSFVAKRFEADEKEEEEEEEEEEDEGPARLPT